MLAQTEWDTSAGYGMASTATIFRGAVHTCGFARSHRQAAATVAVGKHAVPQKGHALVVPYREVGAIAFLPPPTDKPQAGLCLRSQPSSRWAIAVPARVILEVATYLPGRNAKETACPAFFAVCLHDSVAPA